MDSELEYSLGGLIIESLRAFRQSVSSDLALIGSVIVCLISLLLPNDPFDVYGSRRRCA